MLKVGDLIQLKKRPYARFINAPGGTLGIITNINNSEGNDIATIKFQNGETATLAEWAVSLSLSINKELS